MSKAKKLPKIKTDLEAHNTEEDHFWQIKEGFGEIFWDSDADLKIVYCSANIKDSLGYSTNEFTGKILSEHFDEVTRERFFKKISSLNSGSIKHVAMECPISTKIGETKWFLINFKILMDENGKNIGYRGSILDVNSEHEIETEYLKQQESAVISSKVASMVEMSRGVAHEINNPLTILTGNIFRIKMMIDKDPIKVDEVHKFLDILEKCTNRITDIVSSLKEFSRDASSDPIKPVKLKTILDSVYSFCSERLRIKDIEIKVLHFSNDIEIMCRATQLGQMFLNLVNNSQDELEKSDGDKWIEITVEELKKDVRINVTDSGQGIPKEVAEKIFDPFYTTKAVGSGTGLGLSNAYGIIKELEGKFEVDHDYPNTRFVITLPKFIDKNQK